MESGNEKTEEGAQGTAEEEDAGLGEEAGQREDQAAEGEADPQPGVRPEDGDCANEDEEEEEAQVGKPEVLGTMVSDEFMKFEPKVLDRDALVAKAASGAEEIRKQEQSKALRNATKAKRLIREDFDTLENDYSAAYSRKEVGIFVGDDRLSSHGKIGEYLRNMDKVHVYLAWDGNIYPRFFIEEVVLK